MTTTTEKVVEALRWWTSDEAPVDFGEWVEEGIQFARAALASWEAERAALSTPAVPAGFVLVPVEPTPEMMRAAVIYANGSAVYLNLITEDLRIEEDLYGEVWAAMLAAAPKQPVPAVQGEAQDAARYRRWRLAYSRYSADDRELLAQVMRVAGDPAAIESVIDAAMKAQAQEGRTDAPR